MYNVSSNFHNLAIADAPTTRCRIYFIGDAVNCWDDNDVQTNGTLLVGAAGDTDSNGRIGQDGITVSEIFNKDKNLTLGGTVSYQIGMTVVNYDGALDNFAFGRCKVYLDVYDAANSAWLACPLGVFRIELPVKRKVGVISCVGYDQMQTLNAIADTWWNGLNFTGGLTIANILNSMVTQLGLHLSTASSTNMVNGSLSFTTPPIDSVERTYRDILGWIAEATGTVAHFNRDGELDMRPYLTPQIGGNNIVINSDTTGNNCLSVDIAEYSVSQIDALTIKLTNADQGVTVGSGTNAYTIMDNPFLYGDTTTIIQNKITPIYNRLNGYGSYSPVSVRLIYDWSIEAGDIIYILNDSTTYALPIFQQKMMWRGGYVTAELISSGDTVRPQVSSSERETYRYNKEMATKVGDNEIISKINQSAEQITIQANKINLVGTVTANNGFVVNQDGTVEMNGGTVNGTITVGGANNADGILYIKDANGNTAGRIDRNGIEVYQSEYGRINSLAFSGGYMIMTTGGTTAAFLNRFTSGAGWFGVYDSQGRVRAVMNGATANLYAVDENGLVRAEIAADGTLALTDANQIRRFYMGLNGLFDVKDTSGNIRYQLDSADGSIVSKDASEVKRSELNNSGLTVYDSNGTVIGSLLESTGKSDLTVDDATVNGVLDVTQRRCSATLSSAGWYRILTISSNSDANARGSDGFIVDLRLTRNYVSLPSEVHSVKINATYDNIVFTNETSVSYLYAFGITKIRYVVNGTHAYVDVYYQNNYTESVAAYFNVSIRPEDQSWFSSNNFIPVSTSPAGETIITTYDFSAVRPAKYVLMNTRTLSGNVALSQAANIFDEIILSFLTDGGDITTIVIPKDDLATGRYYMACLQWNNRQFESACSVTFDSTFTQATVASNSNNTSWCLGLNKIYGILR